MQVIQFFGSNQYNCNKSYKEHNTSPYAKEMHRFFAKSIQKPKSYKIEISIKEPARPKFTFPMLTRLVLHNLFANFSKAGIFSQYRYVSMHIVINLNTFCKRF